ncbi:amidohydrolase family protein [Sphingomonas sp.]|uniref:amidohydrolase n=1 Tax=Sphingomonas sp. TaxID=28214 RepID=UPI00286AA65B|nr:amidohydrolase family protein [Sphingomonas sp.]
MNRTLTALAAALLSSPALANTLIDHVHGIQVGANGKLQHFESLLIGDDGKVIRTLRGTEDFHPKNATVIDGQGRTLLPGLIDAHGHIMSLGFTAMQLDLTGTNSLADLQQRLRVYAAANPDVRWIVGRGWNQELWPDQRFPTSADLDAVVSDRPVWLERIDGHAAVANSAAMKSAGVTAATKAPPGGRIESGLFVDAARDLIDKAVPTPSSAELDQAFAKAQDILLGYGVTATAVMGTPLDYWDTMRRSGDAGGLRMRVFDYAEGVEPLKTIPKPTPWLYRDRLRMVGVKLYADGALGSRGAWLKQPYSDEPETRGLQFHSDAELLALADTAAAAGFQVATHAIGDAANAQVIATYEQLARKYPGDRRWRIEHVQIVDPIDIPRIARAGIIASMQPTHQTSDRLMAEKRLGPNRLAGAYAWNTILKAGAHLAFGSDFPVESPNPFPGLAAAISRQGADGEPAGGWRPQERVSFATALAGFTREAAYASFAEDRVGALEPGKWADFILVDRDVSTVDAAAIYGTQVLETWVAGKPVWRRAPSAVSPERGK